MYDPMGQRRRRRRIWPWLVAGLLLIVVAGMVIVRQFYFNNLQPVSSNQQTRYVTVERGATAADVADQLKNDGLIRNGQVFKWYLNSRELRGKLQAGTYALRADMSVQDIAGIITEGRVAADNITILPGQPLDQIKSAFLKAGFSEAAVEKAFDPANYPNATALTDKPANANLEGFLYPETFQKSDTTDPSDIVSQSLRLMGEKLTPQVRAAFAADGLTVYQGVTLASMVEQEVAKPADRAQAAQVFIRRLRENIPLGSDVTAFYGARLAGQKPTATFDSAYSTSTKTGLPPGPISNVSESSIQAAAYPAKTNWLFFVAGDDGTTYFSNTLAEHEALTKQHCTKLCSGAE